MDPTFVREAEFAERLAREAGRLLLRALRTSHRARERARRSRNRGRHGEPETHRREDRGGVPLPHHLGRGRRRRRRSDETLEVDRRPARWHDQFRPRISVLVGLDRPRIRRADRGGRRPRPARGRPLLGDGREWRSAKWQSHLRESNSEPPLESDQRGTADALFRVIPIVNSDCSVPSRVRRIRSGGRVRRPSIWPISPRGPSDVCTRRRCIPGT